jgi:DNA repair exonuclease SbcCD nuclease subunit
LLVCGDLYEQGYAKRSTFHFIREQMERLRTIPALVIPGNHDPDTPDSFYSYPDWPENVRILRNGSEVYEHAPTGTRVFCGLPEAAGTDGAGRAAQAAGAGSRGGKPAAGTRTPGGPAGAGFDILMLHGTLDMPFSKDAYRPVSSAELDAAGFDYCALGHFHSVVRGAGAAGRIYNAGSPEPLGFDEEGEHGVFVVTLEKPDESGASRVEAVFKPVGARRYRTLEVQLEGCFTNEQAAAFVASAMENAGSAQDSYRIELKGYVNRSYRPDTRYISDLLADKAFYVKIIDSTVPDYDFEALSKEPGLRGLFVRKMLDRAAEASDEEGRKLALRALYYGMEAIDEGSVCI